LLPRLALKIVAFLKSEMDKWGRVIKNARITAE
jgi:hypothetical protein